MITRREFLAGSAALLPNLSYSFAADNPLIVNNGKLAAESHPRIKPHS